MKNKGITLISLVITIIVILILVTVTVYNGSNTVKSSKFKVFETKLKIMQSEVNSLYDKWKSGEINLNTYGVDIEESPDTKAFTYLGKTAEEKEGYRYYDRETIDELGIEGVEGETYFVNLEKRSVISCEGFEYEGTTYYELDQFVNNLYNVEYEEENITPEFDVSLKYIQEGLWRFNIYNIRENENINKWYVKYRLVEDNSEETTWYTSENYTFNVTKEGTYKIKLVNGSNQSAVKEESCFLSKKITKDNYGDYVNYSIDLGIDGDWDNDTNDIDDWRIFYNDGENVFLIASDCIPNEKYDLSKLEATKVDNYRINWYNDFTMQSVDSNILSKFKSTDYNLNSNNMNSKCASVLLNSDNWGQFVDDDIADYAIGSPTIEMLTDSWNELGFNGITVGTNEQGYTASGNLSFNGSNIKTLFVPHDSWYLSYYGYWLASPADTDGNLWSEYVGNGLTGYYYGNSAHGVRPVVMLNANVFGEKDQTSGVWDLYAQEVYCNHESIEDYYLKRGETVFDGTNYINTGMYLFNEANVNKDFEISFDIVNRVSTGGQATMVNSMDESGTPWPGFVYRIESGDKFKVNATANTEDRKEVINPSNTVSKVIIKRKGGVIYLNINDTTDELVLDMKNLAKTFNVPVTFGASLKGNGDPQRFFNGILSNLKIIIYSN